MYHQHDNDCPECGAPALDVDNSPVRQSFCFKDHEWHQCPVHSNIKFAGRPTGISLQCICPGGTVHD